MVIRGEKTNTGPIIAVRTFFRTALLLREYVRCLEVKAIYAKEGADKAKAYLKESNHLPLYREALEKARQRNSLKLNVDEIIEWEGTDVGLKPKDEL
jgi:hypothetical protein